MRGKNSSWSGTLHRTTLNFSQLLTSQNLSFDNDKSCLRTQPRRGATCESMSALIVLRCIPVHWVQLGQSSCSCADEHAFHWRKGGLIHSVEKGLRNALISKLCPRDSCECFPSYAGAVLAAQQCNWLFCCFQDHLKAVFILWILMQSDCPNHTRKVWLAAP